MMVTGCKNPCHHSGGSAADYYNFAHGIFACIYFTLQIVYFIMVPRLRFATINIDMYHWVSYTHWHIIFPGIIFFHNNAKEPACASSFFLFGHI